MTNLILTCSLDEDAAIADLNEEISNFRASPLTDTRQAATGIKALEAGIYIAACNYLNLPDLIDAIQRASWADPESVQLFYQEQEDERFTEAQLNLTRG